MVPYDLISLDSNTLEHYRFIWPNRHTYTDACLPLGFGAIYNHSEEPSVNWDVDEKKRVVTFTALRDIMVGEELLFDYKYNTESDF